MLFCSNCGEPIQEGAAFCIKCGTRIDEEDMHLTYSEKSDENTEPVVKIKKKAEKTGREKTIIPEKQEKPEMQKKTVDEKKTTVTVPDRPVTVAEVKPEKKGGFPKKLILILAAAAVLVVGFFAVKRVVAPPIQGGASFVLVDIRDCVSVDVEGYDGNGIISVSVDNSAIEEKLNDKEYNLSKAVASTIAYAVIVTPAETEKLANGQQVMLKVSGDSETMGEYNLRFAETAWPYTVAGLTPCVEINPFDYAEVTFEGISPGAKAKCERKSVSSDIGELEYEFDKRDGLAKGDQVVLTCTNDPQWFLDNGYRLTETERTYTVDEVTSYIKYPSEITETALSRMKKEAEDTINAMLEEHKSDSKSVDNTGLQYLGLLVNSRKELDWTNNEVILVYSTTISSSRQEPATIYLPYGFYNVVEYSDGTIDYESDKPAYGRDTELYPHGYIYESAFQGFSDSTTMFSKLVRSRTDEYTYELSEDLKTIF